MFAALFITATIILVWVAFIEDRPDVIVVKEYYHQPKDIEMSEIPSTTSSTSQGAKN